MFLFILSLESWFFNKDTSFNKFIIKISVNNIVIMLN